VEVLRLMSRCNNRCLFCMVEDEIQSSEDAPLQELVDRLDQLPPGSTVDLFGGEPTLYPHFFELLEHLTQRSLSIHIASNGKRFADRPFAGAVARFAPTCVRTSIYGDDASSHDSLTRTGGSFEATLQGVANLVDLGIRVSVNYVIFQNNVGQVLASTDRLYQMGARGFKYSLPVKTGRFLHLLADLDTVRVHLRPALDYLEERGQEFLIEKAPFCLAPQHARRYFMESDAGMVDALGELYGKGEACADCVLEAYCHGIETGYLERFGEAGVRPLGWEALPPDLVRIVSWDELLHTDIPSGLALYHLSDEEALLDPGNLEHFLRLAAAKRRQGSLIGLV